MYVSFSCLGEESVSLYAEVFVKDFPECILRESKEKRLESAWHYRLNIISLCFLTVERSKLWLHGCFALKIGLRVWSFFCFCHVICSTHIILLKGMWYNFSYRKISLQLFVYFSNNSCEMTVGFNLQLGFSASALLTFGAGVIIFVGPFSALLGVQKHPYRVPARYQQQPPPPVVTPKIPSDTAKCL